MCLAALHNQVIRLAEHTAESISCVLTSETQLMNLPAVF